VITSPPFWRPRARNWLRRTTRRPLIRVVASYERFKAWQLSYELVLKIYEATDSFPNHELYGLTAQTRRAAFSVVANIAEGSAKQGRGEFRRFLDIALGSITELLRNHAGAVTWRLYAAVQGQRRPDR
jgi:four helix bundle protein